MSDEIKRTAKIPAWACARCECYEGVDSHEIQLLGSYVTRLCLKCIHEWDAICNGNQKYDRLMQIDIEKDALLSMSVQPGADYRGALEKLRSERRAIKLEFYALAQKFVEDSPAE